MPIEKDLVLAQELILWADHVVLSYPNWWGFMPGLLLPRASSTEFFFPALPSNTTKEKYFLKSF